MLNNILEVQPKKNKYKGFRRSLRAYSSLMTIPHRQPSSHHNDGTQSDDEGRHNSNFKHVSIPH